MSQDVPMDRILIAYNIYALLVPNLAGIETPVCIPTPSRYGELGGSQSPMKSAKSRQWEGRGISRSGDERRVLFNVPQLAWTFLSNVSAHFLSRGPCRTPFRPRDNHGVGGVQRRYGYGNKLRTWGGALNE